MRSLLVVFTALLFCALLSATPVTITDPYAGSNPIGASNGDVIGDLSRFDIDMISFTKVTDSDVELDVLFNYNEGDASLSTFNIGGGSPDLNPGDVLFNVGGNLAFGVALTDHNSLIAGHLYQLTGAQTSYDVLQWLSMTSTNYRPSEYVWMDPVGATDVGTGAVLSSVLDHTELLVKLAFKPSAGFLTDLGTGMGVQFASATCGNDILQGNVKIGAVPEPATLSLVGLALLGLGLLRRGRRG